MADARRLLVVPATLAGLAAPSPAHAATAAYTNTGREGSNPNPDGAEFSPGSDP